MNHVEEIRQSIFKISDDDAFNELALKIFRFQYETNTIYREFSDLLGKDPRNTSHHLQIPFLPISLFRDQKIISGGTLYEKYLPVWITGMPSHYICLNLQKFYKVV
jgi:hypothetical protein